MRNTPIILDTDIGSDIDDAVALAYLLRQPDCELVGVTTVSGEPEKRASLADAILRAGGRDDISVHVGVGDPLIAAQKQPHAPQYAALGERWPHREFDRRVTAIEYLRETIRARPGEITLLPIGPLTNIGLLFSIDPDIPRLVKQVVLMGGQFFSRRYGGMEEWNIKCDPHAAAIVFRAPVPRMVAVGLDVTEQCKLDAGECRRRFDQAGGPLAPVGAMAEVWFDHASHITFHDPLAAALIFEPSLCETMPYKIGVELTSPNLSGTTFLADGEDRPHLVTKTVKVEAFFEHYFGVVGG